jgi:hypothetical protein
MNLDLFWKQVFSDITNNSIILPDASNGNLETPDYYQGFGNNNDTREFTFQTS